jgi:hypothetical protein
MLTYILIFWVGIIIGTVVSALLKMSTPLSYPEEDTSKLESDGSGSGASLPTNLPS